MSSIIDNPGVRECGHIYEVDDFSLLSCFNKLYSNRDVKESDVRKMMKEIREAGRIINAVNINEKEQTIDGQHRIEAAKRLWEEYGEKYPIRFYFTEGAEIEAVIAANTSGKKWTHTTFAESHAARGISSYTILQQLCDKHKNYLRGEVVTKVVRQFAGRCSPKDFDKGNMRLPENIIDLHKQLDELDKYSQAVNDFNQRCHTNIVWPVFNALLFCLFYSGEDVDKQHMLDAFIKASTNYKYNLQSNTHFNVELLEDIYNKNMPKNKHVSFNYPKDGKY